MGIKIKNKIVDDFNKSYDCKLTAEDIIAKTDYFNTSPQTSQKVNPLFKVRYSYAFMYTLIIFLSLSVCGLFGYNQYIKKVDYCHQIVEVEPTLTDEDINFLSNLIVKFDNLEYSKVMISKSDYLVIYRGIDKKDTSRYIYFYKLKNNHSNTFNYTLIINDEKKVINNEKLFGILTTSFINDSLYDKIEFEITFSSISYEYSLVIPK